MPALSMVATAGPALALVVGFFGAVHPALDAFSHLRVHFAVLMGIFALPLLAMRFLKFGVLALLGAILAIATTSGSMPIPAIGMHYGPLHPVDLQQPVYRLLQANLRYDNRDPGLFLSLVGRMQPDVITLNEVSTLWEEKLRLLEPAYPYSIACRPQGGAWAVAILSRRPFAAAEAPRCDQRGAFAVGVFSFGGRPITVATMHLGWPWPFEQAWQVGGLTPYLQSIGEPAILAGDMNAVPWSHTVARVAEAGSFTLMPSPGATWLSLGLPRVLAGAGLPIDQVFAKGGVRIHAIRTLEDIASDHLPVLVEFSIEPGQTPPQSEISKLALAPASRTDDRDAGIQFRRMRFETSRSTAPPG
jgi:endonuclease/exonuclease/phosphatase (EEP) superfamily protein YafD